MVLIPLLEFGGSFEVHIVFGARHLLKLHDLPTFNTTNSCLSNKPILGADGQKKNKNHF
jgi:hypothetical protein